MNRIPVKEFTPAPRSQTVRTIAAPGVTPGRLRCQSCGALANLEVHHRELRSQSGDDAEQNLITLCTRCHSVVHRGTD